MVGDQHYFAKPARTLFRDLRPHFPIGDWPACGTSSRATSVPPRSCSSDCRAPGSTPTATRCSAARRRVAGPRASGSRCTQRLLPVAPASGRDGGGRGPGGVRTARGVAARAERTRRASQPRPMARRRRRTGGYTFPGHAPRGRRRRDVHGRRARGRRPAGHGEGPETPKDQSEGVMEAVRAALEAAGAEAGDIEVFAHGMTVATNALLEGNGARTALVATEGFTDVVELGRQARADLYRLCAAHPAPLVPPERRFAAPERMGPDGVLRDSTTRPRRARRRGRRAASPRPSRSASCTPTAIRSTSARPRRARRPARRRRPRLAVARDGRHVPRVRARRDHRG